MQLDLFAGDGAGEGADFGKGMTKLISELLDMQRTKGNWESIESTFLSEIPPANQWESCFATLLEPDTTTG